MSNKPDRIVLASNNAKKVAELQGLLSGLGITVLPQKEFNVEDAIEDGQSFVENAIIKARHACEKTGLPAIADDSGLAVDALDGAPGIYSARFAGEPCNDKNNNRLLLEKLSGETNRRAGFHCALVYMEHAADPTPVVCQASWHGEILKEEKGQGGFGYDPLFFIESEGCTSAELSPQRKSALSHRGQAMQLLLGELENRFSR